MVLETLKRSLLGTPYEGKVWLVGGAVRDFLLHGNAVGDMDLVVAAEAELPEGIDAPALAEQLWRQGVADHPPVSYPRFGTAMVSVSGQAVELASARSESYDARSRKPRVAPATLEQDAKRRDFTVNALYQNLHDGRLADPTGWGEADLQGRCLRTPMPPKATFAEDPLRMLRAVRFRWQLGFEFAEGLANALKSEAGRLSIVSAERVRDEWVKMLSRPSGPHAMEDLRQLGLLQQFAPEFASMVGVDQGSYHHLDVWGHSLLVLENRWRVEPQPSVLECLAALLHDVGKPATRSVDAMGRVRFLGHEVEGARMAAALLRRLKFSNREVEEVGLLVKNHMRLGSAPTLSPSAARRLLRDLGDSLPALLALVKADVSSLKPGVEAMDVEAIGQRIDEVARESPRERLRSPLTGSELMALFGLAPGPALGALKAHLTELVLDGALPAGDRDAATEAARRYLDDLRR